MKLAAAITLSAVALSVTGCEKVAAAWQLFTYEITLASAEQSDTTVTEVTATTDSSGKNAQLLSAFFGLDDGLPPVSNRGICDGAANKDGMPVIFSHEIDFATLQAGDFRVTSESGTIGQINCVTLAPADDLGELRTALVVGSYGSIDAQPAKVEIVGNLLSKDNDVNFLGLTVDVIRLEDGPTISLAQVVPEEQWELGKQATALPWGGGSGCPPETKQIIRVTWAGGVTKPGGADADELERDLYELTIQTNAGPELIRPVALADLGDSDNNHKLCLDSLNTVTSVFFPAGYLTDPREDLNPDSRISISK